MIVRADGAQSNLNWTSVQIVRRGHNFIDVQYTATSGDMFHWVIYDDLAGAYQYFVNKALPVLGEFRTLFRLDNTTFTSGHTPIKDEPLPPYAWYQNSTKVQDETWQLADGKYITKYDWAAFLRTVDYYGVYGEGFGSWYINPGKDEYNGNHLKQELMVYLTVSMLFMLSLYLVPHTHLLTLCLPRFTESLLPGTSFN